MPKPISVIISSLRPDRLEATIDNISSESDLVEVVVASVHAPKPRDFVIHVPVPAPGQANELTFTQKYNLACAQAGGEYIVYNNDDLHFTPGWSRPLIEHMQKVSVHPYVAAFQIATKGEIIARHTIFGLLYANHGCIRKRDLELVGGQLLDERIYMYYSELDLALRVWSAGGKIAICDPVVMHADRDVDQVAVPKILKEKSNYGQRKPQTYRDLWYRHDTRVFFRLWFFKYFGLFWKHYPRLKELFSSTDGVLPPQKQKSPLWQMMFLPVINLFINPKRWFVVHHKIDFVLDHWVRLTNRRWGALNYQLPYDANAVELT